MEYALSIAMSGLVKKTNFFKVCRSFGVIAAIKFLFSHEKTFLDFCRRHHLI